jgi:histidyl-tRNA synthetase
LGGGRYDGLAESLGSKVAAPGIGFSIGEDRLVMTVEESKAFSNSSSVDVFLATMGGAAEDYAGGLAAELRANNISVERSVDRKLKRAMEVANRTGARFVVIIGDDEIASGSYSVKNMATTEQVKVARADLGTHIRSLLNS